MKHDYFTNVQKNIASRKLCSSVYRFYTLQRSRATVSGEEEELEEEEEDDKM